MLYVVLICSNEACAEEIEAWGELEDVEQLVCEGCGALLQPLSFAEEVAPAPVIRLHRRTASPHARRAA